MWREGSVLILASRAVFASKWYAACLLVSIASVSALTSQHAHGLFPAGSGPISTTAAQQTTLASLSCPVCALAHTPPAFDLASLGVAPPMNDAQFAQWDRSRISNLFDRVAIASRAPPA